MTIDTAMPPMEALSVKELPVGKAWRYEPKWDGFRCLAYKVNGKVVLRSKSGKPLERYFPDIVAMLEGLKVEQFALDGELVIRGPDGSSFGDLQLRLHPAASRVNKLAAESPATYVLFDMLETPKGEKLAALPLRDRRERLEAFFAAHGKAAGRLELSQQTASLKTAQGWLTKKSGQVDGLVAKNTEDAYAPGERQMQKFKPVRTADCVVGGFRFNEGSPYVGSLLLGLYDDEGLLNHVGYTSNIAAKDKKALTVQLEKLVEAPGFTGKAPGGPSRWSTDRTGDWQPLRPELVVEVSFDHVSEERFRHGTRLLRWRPDKAPGQCRMEQIL